MRVKLLCSLGGANVFAVAFGLLVRGGILLLNSLLLQTSKLLPFIDFRLCSLREGQSLSLKKLMQKKIVLQLMIITVF
jgi:hypothetical protein